MITSLAAKFFLTSIGKKLPPWLWEIIIVALLIGAGMLWHHSRIVSHDNQVRATQKTADDRVIAIERANEAALRKGLTDQNAAVQKLAAQTKAEQRQAAQASQEAATEAKQLQKVSDSLISSSRSSERQSAPCAPSKTLQEQWQ